MLVEFNRAKITSTNYKLLQLNGCKIAKVARQTMKFLKAHAATILVLLSYVFFTTYYMGPSVWDCKNTVYGFGDNTAGPIWRFSLKPQQPILGSYQNETNFPVGEELYSPTSYSLLGQTALIWAGSRTVGPICGYNIVNMLGFITSAAVMYGFIFVLTKRRWIAWLAGFAVSFSPYYQMKVGGHVGYGYQGLLIGSVWAFFNLVTKRRKRDAAVFGVVTAAAAYFDPYFSLLVGAIIGPLALTWIGLGWFKDRKKKADKKIFIKTFKNLVLGFGIFAVLMLPLAGVIVKHSSQISSSVSALRGNVLFEAKACSNLPHEYAVPFVLHPVFQRIMGKNDYIGLIDSLHNGFGCGIGEDTVGISIAVLTITGLGVTIMAWERLNNRRLKLGLTYRSDLVTVGISAVLVVGMLMALPPGRVLGIPTPSYALLEITTTWRTLTRFYVIVNFATITLFSLVLLYAANYFKQYRKILLALFVAIFFTIFVEYQAFKPFTGNKLSTFSYKEDAPEIYTWLRDQLDIKTIAEYPMEKAGGESNAAAYYLTMQSVHKKKLFNANDPLVYEEELRASLKDVSDPQALGVLAGSGIDAVVIHGVSEEVVRSIEGLEVVRVSPQSPFNILAFTPLVKNDITIIAKVIAPPATSMIRFENGFVRNATVIRSAVDWEYEAINGATMAVSRLPGGSEISGQPVKQCFYIRFAAENQSAQIQLKIDGMKEIMIDASSTYGLVEVDAGKSIAISNSTGQNMRVKDIGCN